MESTPRTIYVGTYAETRVLIQAGLMPKLMKKHCTLLLVHLVK